MAIDTELKRAEGTKDSLPVHSLKPRGLTPGEELRWASQERVLEAFGKLGTVLHATRAASIDPKTHYNWMDADTLGYRARFGLALEHHADLTEGLMHERLTDPQGNRGSDILLIFKLKGLRPDRWREAALTVDDAAKDTLKELRKLRREELRQEKEEKEKEEE